MRQRWNVQLQKIHKIGFEYYSGACWNVPVVTIQSLRAITRNAMHSIFNFLLSFFNLSWFGFTCCGPARHKTSLRHANRRNKTELSQYSWSLKDWKKLSERWIDQLDTNIGQRKNLNSWQLLNPWPPELWVGSLSTELWELIKCKVI